MMDNYQIIHYHLISFVDLKNYWGENEFFQDNGVWIKKVNSSDDESYTNMNLNLALNVGFYGIKVNASESYILSFIARTSSGRPMSDYGTRVAHAILFTATDENRKNHIDVYTAASAYDIHDGYNEILIQLESTPLVQWIYPRFGVHTSETYIGFTNIMIRKAETSDIYRKHKLSPVDTSDKVHELIEGVMDEKTYGDVATNIGYYRRTAIHRNHIRMKDITE